FNVNGQRAEISIVDAHEIGAGINRSHQLTIVVDLDQCVESETSRRPQKPDEFVLVERRDDQQHRISTGSPRLDELVFGDDEILSEERSRNRCPYGTQVIERAIEKCRFRQY